MLEQTQTQPSGRREQKYPYTREQREEHNLIARALALGHSLTDLPVFSSADAPQPAPDALSSEMYGHWQRDFKLCHDALDALLRGKLEKALELAKEEYAARRRFSRSMQEYAKRTKGSSGARGAGHTYYLKLEGTEFYFDCILCWADDERLEVLNTRELELLAGCDVTPAAWTELAAWVCGVVQNRRMMMGDEETLIWADNQNETGSLRYRQTLERKYPHLHMALEVIRCTLRLYREETPNSKFELAALAVLDASGLGNHGRVRVRPKKVGESLTSPQPT